MESITNQPQGILPVYPGLIVFKDHAFVETVCTATEPQLGVYLLKKPAKQYIKRLNFSYLLEHKAVPRQTANFQLQCLSEESTPIPTPSLLIRREALPPQ